MTLIFSTLRLNGKANIIDNYGEKWEASFDGECTVNGEKGRTHNMHYGEPNLQARLKESWEGFSCSLFK